MSSWTSGHRSRPWWQYCHSANRERAWRHVTLWEPLFGFGGSPGQGGPYCRSVWRWPSAERGRTSAVLGSCWSCFSGAGLGSGLPAWSFHGGNKAGGRGQSLEEEEVPGRPPKGLFTYTGTFLGDSWGLCTHRGESRVLPFSVAPREAAVFLGESRASCWPLGSRRAERVSAPFHPKAGHHISRGVPVGELGVPGGVRPAAERILPMSPPRDLDLTSWVAAARGIPTASGSAGSSNGETRRSGWPWTPFSRRQIFKRDVFPGAVSDGGSDAGLGGVGVGVEVGVASLPQGTCCWPWTGNSHRVKRPSDCHLQQTGWKTKALAFANWRGRACIRLTAEIRERIRICMTYYRPERWQKHGQV